MNRLIKESLEFIRESKIELRFRKSEIIRMAKEIKSLEKLVNKAKKLKKDKK